jgi:hypothetical protein
LENGNLARRRADKDTCLGNSKVYSPKSDDKLSMDQVLLDQLFLE